MVLAVLAIGLSGEFLISLSKVTGSFYFGGVSSAGMLLLMYGLWFGFTWMKPER
jgi:hypothetical protein